MAKEKRHLYCLLTKSGDFEGLILTNVQQIIDYWHKITQCVFSWWHHWIVAIITIILLLNYLNPSFIWFSLCTFHLTRGKHQHNVLRDIISITTNTLHITPDSDSCHETRVELHVTPTACCVTQLVTGTRVTCVLPGAAIFTRDLLRSPDRAVSGQMTPDLVTRDMRSPPQLVLRHTSAHTHGHWSCQYYGQGTGNKLDFSKNQNKSSPHGILRARGDSLQKRLGLGVLQDE